MSEEKGTLENENTRNLTAYRSVVMEEGLDVSLVARMGLLALILARPKLRPEEKGKCSGSERS